MTHSLLHYRVEVPVEPIPAHFSWIDGHNIVFPGIQESVELHRIIEWITLYIDNLNFEQLVSCIQTKKVKFIKELNCDLDDALISVGYLASVYLDPDLRDY
jgi:hypothetical protein